MAMPPPAAAPRPCSGPRAHRWLVESPPNVCSPTFMAAAAAHIAAQSPETMKVRPRGRAQRAREAPLTTLCPAALTCSLARATSQRVPRRALSSSPPPPTHHTHAPTSPPLTPVAGGVGEGGVRGDEHGAVPGRGGSLRHPAQVHPPYVHAQGWVAARGREGLQSLACPPPPLPSGAKDGLHLNNWARAH